MQAKRPLHPNDRDAVSALIQYLDSCAKKSKLLRSNQRQTGRRKLQAECIVCFMARDGGTMICETGLTRDVSEDGLGCLLRRRLAPGTQLRTTVLLPEGRECHLTGVVAHNKPEQGEWFLIGVRFEDVDDERLSPPVDLESSDDEDESSEEA